MKLEDIITVKVGRNLSRVKETGNPPLEIYSYEDLENDLDGLYLDNLDSRTDMSNKNISDKDSHLSRGGHVVFSFVSSKAAIMSDQNAGKMINQNFAQLLIKHELLHRSYLCYVLNESNAMKKQMAMAMQGSTVPKLTPSILKTLDMKLPSIEKQQTIGKAYLSVKKRQALAKKQVDLEEQLYLEVLQQLDK